MQETTIDVATIDGLHLQVYRWAPEDAAPKAVVQIQHGLAEHAARYRRFAEALTAAGYVVYGPDARGSGRTAEPDYGNWGPAGWPGWVADVGSLVARIRADEPDLPLALFGHSMGSFASQAYVLDHSADIDALVLCGSTEVAGLVDIMDSDEPADLSAFNAPFESRTGYEWLTRDEAEVDAYVADPGCGWVAPTPADFGTLKRAADPEAIVGIRPDLPILIVSGDADPVAGPGAIGPQVVGARYQEAGVRDVTVRLYPGARHELLNETNRDEVTADVLAFLDRTLKAG